MRKIMKKSIIAFSIMIIIYIIYSIWFWEYIYRSNKILWYYWDDTISGWYFIIPWEKIRLFDFEDKTNSFTWKKIQLTYSKSFLFYSRDDIVSFNFSFFKNFPKKDFSLTNRISDIFMHNESLNEKDLLSLFQKYYKNFIKIYWEPNFINNDNWDINYIWMKNNEILYVSKIINLAWGYYYLNIWILDKRFIDINWYPSIGLFKKSRSPILLISRFWFMKKIWYIDN
ncbi:MAG: hypothetical protein ACD_49C00019G0003 [uncultured bacterium (gcode 4)]|uniref:Uncharacterized protein n=1 Tax=uncultured bacterium (gcode 4) TaxID=1234023 RepID=K2AFG6_9BACT|nr:MAG: hypothetical protein ACD_49C00019G0003 [uncultured bacterium (gcode 4)]